MAVDILKDREGSRDRGADVLIGLGGTDLSVTAGIIFSSVPAMLAELGFPVLLAKGGADIPHELRLGRAGSTTSTDTKPQRATLLPSMECATKCHAVFYGCCPLLQLSPRNPTDTSHLGKSGMGRQSAHTHREPCFPPASLWRRPFTDEILLLFSVLKRLL